jgi:glycosyltransferase involved in cell wall biosynthesis
MKITVILCTYNRCVSLARAIESVAASRLSDPFRWEVLVVDNNSPDQTREVVAGFCGRYPGRIRYLFEPKPGKSNALNAGIRETDADVLAFMDDDVVVEPTWLQELSAPLLNGPWAGVGGRILLQPMSTTPNWLPTNERYGLAPLAMFDLGTEAGPLHEPPYGTNMAFRRRVFEKYSGFRTDLGPRAGDEVKNEDSEFGQRLMKAGEQLWYEPSAVVYHSVPEKRLQKAYFLRWSFDKARADLRQVGIPDDARWFIAGVPAYFFRRIAVWTVRWLIATRPKERFGARLRVWALAGSIQECRHLALDAKRPGKESRSSK